MAVEDHFKKFKQIVPDYANLEPSKIVFRLSEDKVVKKLKRPNWRGLSEAHVSQIILFLQERNPKTRELEAFIKTGLR